MMRDVEQIPEFGLIRVRTYSRFRNATKYQSWIAYRLVRENELDAEMNDDDDDDMNPIQCYYCTCKTGARMLGTCAHIASILWFMRYARHQQNIRYPSTRLLRDISDAANRASPVDPNNMANA